MRGSMSISRSVPRTRSSNQGPASRGQGLGSGFVVGRNSRGHWTALSAGGLTGGVFRSKDAAIRYAQAEAGRAPGAVSFTSSPVELPFTRNQIGRGDGLPSWWRLERATRGGRSFIELMPVTGNADRRWLAIDLGLAAAFAALCLTVAAVLS